MPQTRTLFLLPLLILLLGLTACVSLAEDITPPPGYQAPTAVPHTPTVDSPVYPMLPSDPARGAPIYAQKCAPCHGENGLGDGPDAAGLPNPVAPLGDPALARQAAPGDWYLTVSNGNLQNFMPPFNSLSVPERWDVIAYAYTLSTTPEEVARGQALYAEHCALCHGARGEGDGPGAGSLSTSPVDFTDQSFMGTRSAADLFASISNGVADTAMPAFDQISEEDRWALTTFLRTLTFVEPTPEADLTAPSQGEPTPEITPTPLEAGSATPTGEAALSETGAVTITVVAVSGQALPSGVEVTLHRYNEMTEVYSITVPLPEDGIIHLEEVPLPPNRFVFATFEYENVLYGSDVALTEPEMTALELTLPYYERTEDPAVLRADRLHVFFGFDLPETLSVYMLYIFSNTSDKVLALDDPDAAAITFSLPEGAVNLQYDVGREFRVVETMDGFGLTEIYPSAEPYQILYSFDLPYTGDKAAFDLPVAMNTSAAIVLIPENGIRFKGEHLSDAGMRDIEGVSYVLYNGSNLRAGDALALEISGRPAVASSPGASAADGRTNLIIGLAAFGLALLGTGVYLWWRTRTDDDLEAHAAETADLEAPEDVMDAIIALDDLFKDGEIPEEAYRQRRAALKAQLKAMLDAE